MKMNPCVDQPDTGADAGRSRSVPALASHGTQDHDKTLRISLKQWRLLYAVVDHGGFAGAASALHVSQSSISHALAKLQDQLGVALLTIRGRKAYLTEAGEVLLDRSRDLVNRALQLEELGESLRQGACHEVRLAVEPSYPSDLLMQALRKLPALPRHIRLSVREASLAEVKESLQNDVLDLAISTERFSGFASNKLIDIEHIAVAHPSNPLFKRNRPVTMDELREQIEVALAGDDDAPGPALPNLARQSPGRWKVSSLDSAAEALEFGLGYAWLPRYRVQRWLDDGFVRILPLNGGSSYIKPLHLIRGRSVSAGSCAHHFAASLHAVAQAHLAELMAGPAYRSGFGSRSGAVADTRA